MPAKLVFAGIFAIGVLVTTARVASRLKGEITIEVADRRYTTGDTISGTVTIVAKQPMQQATVYAYLKATELRNPGVRRSNRSIQDSWSKRVQISGPIDLRRGEARTFGFSIDVPSRQELLDAGVTPQTTESNGVTTRTYGKRVRWDIVGRIATDGFDVTSDRRIAVDL